MAKRIFFICSEFPPGPGGIGNHGFNFIQTLKSKGYEVQVLTNLENASPQAAAKFSEEADLDIIYIPREGRLPIQWRRIKEAFKRARKGNFDYIICSGMFSLWIGRLLMFFMRKPQYMAILHGSEVTIKHRIFQKLTSSAIKAFRTVVSVSHYTQSCIQSQYSWQTHAVIPNAVDVQFLSSFNDRPLSKLSGKPALLTVGNVTKRKGQHNVIQALPEILKLYPQAHYHCIGLPTLAEENKKLAHELGVTHAITFHGKLPVAQLMDAYKGCDIFMMLSENQADGDMEGFGIAILEANYFGKPAIGSIGCGIEDAIEEGYNGFKINNKDIYATATAVSKILMSETDWATQSEAWAAKHNWNDIADDYIKLMA